MANVHVMMEDMPHIEGNPEVIDSLRNRVANFIR